MGTTANYSWPYPESSDYVADGATAIENLADAIDTSLVGSVLQTVQATYSTQVANSTATYIDTGLTASITPQSSSNKVLVFAHQTFGKTSTYSENRVAWLLLRDIGGGTSAIWNSGNIELYTATSLLLIAPFSIAYLDSPATTSSVTYKTQFCNPYGQSAAISQYGSGTATITLLEVKA